MSWKAVDSAQTEIERRSEPWCTDAMKAAWTEKLVQRSGAAAEWTVGAEASAAAGKAPRGAAVLSAFTLGELRQFM